MLSQCGAAGPRAGRGIAPPPRNSLCVLPLLALTALPASAAPDYQTLQNSIRAEHIHPGYKTFSVRAQELEYTITQHCRSREQNPNMLAMQNAFHTALDAWQAVQHIRNGPISVEATAPRPTVRARAPGRMRLI